MFRITRLTSHTRNTYVQSCAGSLLLAWYKMIGVPALAVRWYA